MEMIEKVSRAICRAEGHDPDHNYDPEGLLGRPQVRWMSYDFIARAAIEAMREPDHDMTGAVLKPGEDRTFLVGLWQGMVDAAIERHDAQLALEAPHP